MTQALEVAEVSPRSRIVEFVGILNIVLGVFLMPMSLYLGWVILPAQWTGPAIAEIRMNGEVDLAAARQMDLRALDAAEATATTGAQKRQLEARREAIGGRPRLLLPREMDQERLGMGGLDFRIYSWVDVITALILDALMLAAGIGLLRRRAWGIILGLATAAAKIVRLVLIYGYAALVIVPTIAQGQGRMMFETLIVQQQAAGRPMPAGVSPATYMQTFAVVYTTMALALVFFGSICPGVVLWLLGRPGSRAACSGRARVDRSPTGTRVLGLLNVVFGAFMILFGLGFSVAMDALARTGKTSHPVPQSNQARFVARQKAAFDALARADEKAANPIEKRPLEWQRLAVEARPRPPDGFADAVRIQMGFDDPKFRAYYRFHLANGILLNAAMTVAGIGLLAKKRWGITLGLATAALNLVRMAACYGHFALVLAPTLAERGATMEAQLIALQQPTTDNASLLELDPGPLARVYGVLYPSTALAILALGSIYPAISLWVLVRARRKSMLDLRPPDLTSNKFSPG